MQSLKPGLTLACLLLLSSCASAPHCPAPALTVSGCPSVTPCHLPAAAPHSNDSLNSEIDALEAAWHACAAQIDTIIQCQADDADREGNDP